MELLKIIEADYLDHYRIELSFNDGIRTVVDLKSKVFNDRRKVFKALKDVSYFKNFTKNRWTIEWDNGVDLAPEFLYNLAMEQNQKTVENDNTVLT
jgi:DNA-binding transcriptional regulator GbsR (MarR family)